METHETHDVVRLRLARGVDAQVLRRLHSDGLSAEVPAELRELFASVDARKLRGIYPLQEADFVEDAYGFAREFELALGGGVGSDEALARLCGSALVEAARPLRLEGPA